MKPLLVTIALLFSLQGFATQDKIYSIDKGNIHLSYVTGWPKIEIDTKIKIFLELAEKLARESNRSENVYIFFDLNYTKSDSSYYGLGYGHFSFLDYSRGGNRKIPDGLKIIVRERDFDIKKMLWLIATAFSNADYIKDKLPTLVVKTKYTAWIDTGGSIPLRQIIRQLTIGNGYLDKLKNEKVYRDSIKDVESRDI